MHFSRVMLAALLLLAWPAAAAHAQYGGGKYEHDEPRERRMTHADSTKSLAGSWQVWFHAGIASVAAPTGVNQRYASGLAAGVAGDRRLEDRIALRARITYEDLPSKRSTFVNSYGSSFANTNQGHGWTGTTLVGLALRVKSHFWLEGGGGGGYFKSGIPDHYIDPASGAIFASPGATGWGSLWESGARFEFQPRLRDRLFVEAQFEQMNRAGTPISMWAIRFGYRAR